MGQSCEHSKISCEGPRGQRDGTEGQTTSSCTETQTITTLNTRSGAKHQLKDNDWQVYTHIGTPVLCTSVFSPGIHHCLRGITEFGLASMTHLCLLSGVFPYHFHPQSICAQRPNHTGSPPQAECGSGVRRAIFGPGRAGCELGHGPSPAAWLTWGRQHHLLRP